MKRGFVVTVKTPCVRIPCVWAIRASLWLVYAAMIFDLKIRFDPALTPPGHVDNLR